jgi:hypothetical protein
MEWMKAIGTDAVAIGIHEFQLNYGRAMQLDILFEEARRAGVGVFAIPSRWGGLVAGWPPAAGQFAATHPEAWALNANGNPHFAVFCGGNVCSIFNPELLTFFQETLSNMLSQWPLDGIVWDELKTLDIEDYSAHAVRVLGRPAKVADQFQATIKFFSQANQFARGKKPELVISNFIYAHLPDAAMQSCASIQGLDYFGIDGRCWPGSQPAEKVLFGNMDRARKVCAARGLGSLALVETQFMGAADARRTLEHLPAFLEQPLDHLLYYYHGTSRNDEDVCMDGMRPLLEKWRKN